MDPNPTDIKLDMLRSKTSYWYNEMYVNINIAFGKTQQVIKNCSKLVLLASYTIFNARKTEDWSGQAYLKPWISLF